MDDYDEFNDNDDDLVVEDDGKTTFENNLNSGNLSVRIGTPNSGETHTIVGIVTDIIERCGNQLILMINNGIEASFSFGNMKEEQIEEQIKIIEDRVFENGVFVVKFIEFDERALIWKAEVKSAIFGKKSQEYYC